VNALIYAHRRRIFPSAAAYHLGHDKVQMTRALEGRWPQHLPTTLIRPATPRDADEILERLGLPLVAKDVRSSEGRGVRLIESASEWRDYSTRCSVLYAQEYLPIDRDLRVVVIGRDVVASYWRLQPPGGFLNNLAAGGTLSFDPAPPAALRLVTRIARALGIDHAGFDVAMVGRRPYVLEFNRLFGNVGLREQGIRPAELIHRYLLSRRPRTPRKPRAA
jgi:ribosomal protein S6--L-glutamate ligase